MTKKKPTDEIREPSVFVTEKLYLDKGAWTGKKRILKVELNGKSVPFKQIDEYGRFEFVEETS